MKVRELIAQLQDDVDPEAEIEMQFGPAHYEGGKVQVLTTAIHGLNAYRQDGEPRVLLVGPGQWVRFDEGQLDLTP